MPPVSAEFDFFVSYARRDNADGWISSFIEALQVEHGAYSGGRAFNIFFDKQEIRSLDDWRLRIFDALAASRLFVAFISPAYLSSEWCRREWRTWIDVEIAKHVLSDGAALIYIVEVPWLAEAMSQEEIAQAMAQLTGQAMKSGHAHSAADAIEVSHAISRRQRTNVCSFFRGGVDRLRREDVRKVLAGLAQDLEDRVQQVNAAAASLCTIPPYNRRFVGRGEDLLNLRERLFQGRTGVISGHEEGSLPGVAGVHGLGGIGKTELAFTYAHAFAGLYPGGRFLLPCEGLGDIRLAFLQLDSVFPDGATNEQRKSLDLHFGAIRESLRRRAEQRGRILLVLDNVTDALILSPIQIDLVSVVGPKLHLLATTRLGAPIGQSANDDIHWITLTELSITESLRLLEKHRPFGEAEYEPASHIARRLGGFALCVEVVGAFLAQHPAESYAGFLRQMGLDELEQIDTVAEGREIVLRRRKNDKRLGVILSITLAKLNGDEKKTIDFAALMHPDFVVIPWLRHLLDGAPVESAADGIFDAREDDRLIAIEQRLFALALLTRGSSNEGEHRIVRCHRLVQDYLRARMADLEAKAHTLHRLVRIRDAELKKITNWKTAGWELTPLARLAERWDETSYPFSSWLANQVALKLETIASWPEAEALLRRALAFDRRTRGNKDPWVSVRLNNLARVLFATNRYHEAEESLREALTIDRKNLGNHYTDIVRTLMNLSALLVTTNRIAESEAILREAEMYRGIPRTATHKEEAGKPSRVLGFLSSIFRRDAKPSDDQEATILNNKGELAAQQFRMAEAEDHLLKALTLERTAKGPVHSDIARVLHNLAAIYVKTNRLAEAESHAKEAAEIYEKTLGDHPSLANTLTVLAAVMRSTSRYEEAERLLRRSLSMTEAASGPDHTAVADKLTGLATLFQATERYAEAEPLLRRALEIKEARLGSNHPATAAALNNLAQVLQQTERLSEVEPLLRRSLAIREAGHGKNHPDIATALNNLGAFLSRRKRYSEAEPLMRRALAIDEAALDPDHPDIGRDLSNLAALLMDLKHFTDAEPFQRRLVFILLRFSRENGQRHKILEPAFLNYWGLLSIDLGLPQSDVVTRISELCVEAGFDEKQAAELIGSLTKGRVGMCGFRGKVNEIPG